MAILAKIIGAHPVKADEPVFQIELLIQGDINEFDIGDITQEIFGQPKSDWQVPYDERIIEASPQNVRYAFFFHYLDFNKPLLTPAGEIPLPNATKRPAHLQGIEYQSP